MKFRLIFTSSYSIKNFYAKFALNSKEPNYKKKDLKVFN